MVKLGLVGRSLGYSFSRGYFTEKFRREGLDAAFRYDNYELPEAAEVPRLFARDPQLRGLNVTIPYKRAVIPLLDEVRGAAAALGAVNVITREADGRLVGENTDVVGFALTLDRFGASLPAQAPALVLGTGGASAAVAYVLAQRGLDHRTVSRRPAGGQLGYAALGSLAPRVPRLWVNTTPVGTAPDIEAAPPIPFALFGPGDVVVDLIYNPAETRLLREARVRGAATASGLTMLHGQAEAAWSRWR